MPMLPCPSALAAAFLALAALPALPGVQDPRPASALPVPELAVGELAARDQRISFSAESARRARAVLEAAPLDERERAVAVLALATGRSGADLARIESMAADGNPLERKAALFALGELGADGWPALERALAHESADLEDVLSVALLVAERRGAPRARPRLIELADREDDLAASARWALDPAVEAVPNRLTGALRLYDELRWRAAQRFGLIDGRRWQVVLLDGWLRDDEFLDGAILGACPDLEPAALRTHLLELLAAGDRPAVLHAAALVLPEDLARAHDAGVWRPASADGWRVILDAIDAQRSERAALPLLQIAFRVDPELAPLSGMLIVRAGGDLPWRWVGEQLTGAPSELGLRLIEACGDRGETARIEDLVDLLERKPGLGLLGVGLVALARLGHAPARAELETFAGAPASPERAQVLAALARVLHDRRMRRHAERALQLPDLEDELGLALEIGLARHGELGSRERLRGALAGTPEGELALQLVRALAARPEEEDLALVRSLFPVEEDLALNVELARVLIRQRDPAAGPILRAALWSDAWNRSVLAGGLIARTSGLEGLVDELESPPADASERDLRRVGFSLGEWGGMGAVERLSRTRLEGDPGLQGALLGALSARPGAAEDK